MKGGDRGVKRHPSSSSSSLLSSSKEDPRLSMGESVKKAHLSLSPSSFFLLQLRRMSKSRRQQQKQPAAAANEKCAILQMTDRRCSSNGFVLQAQMRFSTNADVTVFQSEGWFDPFAHMLVVVGLLSSQLSTQKNY